MKTEEEQVDGSEEVFGSLEEILSTSATEYKTYKSWGGKSVRIGSLTAGQMIAFLENNDIPGQRRRNGLILIAQSLVDKNGKRLVETDDNEKMAKAVTSLMTQDAKENGKLVEKILVLNGLNRKDAKDAAKNDSGEAATGASPTD